MTKQVTIKRNDAFNVLATIVKLPEQKLEELIIKKMLEEEYIHDCTTDAGWTIDALAREHKVEIKEIINLLFPEYIDSVEIPELLKSVYFWGNASKSEECPECGCVVDQDPDKQYGGDWVDDFCTNDQCDYATNNDPDTN